MFFLGLVSLAVAARLLRRGFAWRRLGLGVCPVCSYPLQGLPERAACCPECGESLGPHPRDGDASPDAVIGIGVVLMAAGMLTAGFSAAPAWRDAHVVAARLASTEVLAEGVRTTRDPHSLRATTIRAELERRWNRDLIPLPELKAIAEATVLSQQNTPAFRSSYDPLRSMVATDMGWDKSGPRADALREGVLDAVLATTGRVPGEISAVLTGLLPSDALSERHRSKLIDALVLDLSSAQRSFYISHNVLDAEVAAGRVGMHDLGRIILASLRPRLVTTKEQVLRPNEAFTIGALLGTGYGNLKTPVTMSLDFMGEARAWQRLADASEANELLYQLELWNWATYHDPAHATPAALLVAPCVPGEYLIDAHVTVRVHILSDPENDHSFADLANPAPPLLAFSMPLQTTIRVEGEPFPPPRLVETPFNRPDFGDCDRCGNYAWRSPHSDLVGVNLLLDTAPIDVAADVLLEQDGVEHPIGWVYITPERRWTTVVGAAPAIRPGPVNIVLRPNIAPLPTFDPRRLLYEKTLVIPTKVYQPESAATGPADQQ